MEYNGIPQPHDPQQQPTEDKPAPRTAADWTIIILGFLASFKIAIEAIFRVQIPDETLNAIANFAGWLIIIVGIIRNNVRTWREHRALQKEDRNQL